MVYYGIVHTHRPASKHPKKFVYTSPSSPGQQTSRQQQKRFRAAPSQPQSSKQAPNIRSLYMLPLHFQTSKPVERNRKGLEPHPHTNIEYIQYMEYKP